MNDPKRFSVMTMNLRFGLADDGENGWCRRKKRVERFLERHQADFMGFQEINHFQAGFLQRRLAGHHHIGWHNPACQWWQSNMIFFRQSWRCLDRRHFFLSRTPDRQSKMTGSKWPRQCVMGIFESGNTRLLAVNTHFDFDAHVQEKSAHLVLGFISNMDKTLPVVITGDFNAPPGSKAWQVFQENGFQEVYQDAPRGTFHGFSGCNTRRHIDWILFRGRLERVKRDILSDAFDGRFPSDHYPVKAVFSIT